MNTLMAYIDSDSEKENIIGFVLEDPEGTILRVWAGTNQSEIPCYKKPICEESKSYFEKFIEHILDLGYIEVPAHALHTIRSIKPEPLVE